MDYGRSNPPGVVGNERRVRVRRISSVVAVAALMAAMIAVAALPAFALGQNPPTSCGLGDESSTMAQRVGGLGQFLKERGFTPGENNQAVRDVSVDPVCHLDDPGQTP